MIMHMVEAQAEDMELETLLLEVPDDMKVVEDVILDMEVEMMIVGLDTVMVVGMEV